MVDALGCEQALKDVWGVWFSAGNNMKLDAGCDVSIIGSALYAQNDFGLFAERDVNFIPGWKQFSCVFSKDKKLWDKLYSIALNNIGEFTG